MYYSELWEDMFNPSPYFIPHHSLKLGTDTMFKNTLKLIKVLSDAYFVFKVNDIFKHLDHFIFIFISVSYHSGFILDSTNVSENCYRFNVKDEYW